MRIRLEATPVCVKFIVSFYIGAGVVAPSAAIVEVVGHGR
jgi:hypothetical protein